MIPVETGGTRAVQRRKPSVIPMRVNLSDLISCIRMGFVFLDHPFKKYGLSFTCRKEGRLG